MWQPGDDSFVVKAVFILKGLMSQVMPRPTNPPSKPGKPAELAIQTISYRKRTAYCWKMSMTGVAGTGGKPAAAGISMRKLEGPIT